MLLYKFFFPRKVSQYLPVGKLDQIRLEHKLDITAERIRKSAKISSDYLLKKIIFC